MASLDNTLLSQRMKDLTGKRYGKWTVKGFAGIAAFPSGKKFLRWLCRCDCGTVTIVNGQNLSSGITQGCRGCSHIIHGMSHSRTYGIWAAMIQRCENPSASKYANYGGRGISVCKAWRKSFGVFLKDMGNPPSGKHTLDRKDNGRDYSPENCRWATATEQGRNSRHNHMITFKNLTLSLVEWSEKQGINYQTLRYRIRNGWATEKALALPTKKYRAKSPGPTTPSIKTTTRNIVP